MTNENGWVKNVNDEILKMVKGSWEVYNESKKNRGFVEVLYSALESRFRQCEILDTRVKY